MYYFAYGSNCLESRMLKRCPSASVVGLDYLNDCKLVFNKKGLDKTAKANIKYSKGGVVYGIIYNITAEDLKQLDVAEGNGIHYQRTQLTTSFLREKVEVYIAVKDRTDNFIHPSKEYRDIIVQGMLQFKFDEAYINKIKQLKVV